MRLIDAARKASDRKYAAAGSRSGEDVVPRRVEEDPTTFLAKLFVGFDIDIEAEAEEWEALLSVYAARYRMLSAQGVSDHVAIADIVVDCILVGRLLAEEA